jgi:hypothetical protein
MKSEREQDGWFGLVQFVVVEMAEYLDQDGRQTLGRRVPLFTLEYDTEGKRVAEKTYYSLHGTSDVNECLLRQSVDGSRNALFCFSGGEFVYKVIQNFDAHGRIVSELFSDIMGKPHHKREQKYDVHGNPVEMSLTTPTGTVVDRIKYENEYDAVDNLIKVKILKWILDDGRYKPIMVNYQTVTYY